MIPFGDQMKFDESAQKIYRAYTEQRAKDGRVKSNSRSRADSKHGTSIRRETSSSVRSGPGVSFGSRLGAAIDTSLSYNSEFNQRLTEVPVAVGLATLAKTRNPQVSLGAALAALPIGLGSGLALAPDVMRDIQTAFRTGERQYDGPIRRFIKDPGAEVQEKLERALRTAAGTTFKSRT